MIENAKDEEPDIQIGRDEKSSLTILLAHLAVLGCVVRVGTFSKIPLKIPRRK